MPRLDGAGSLGRGPMTGGAKGFCALRANRDVVYRCVGHPMDI